MKKLLLILTIMVSFVSGTFAQSRYDEPESAKPLTDTEVVRRVALLDIEGKNYENVVVSMECVSPDHFFTDNYKVKICVKDEDGKKVWKKTFKNVFLYVFSGGQVQIGKRGFDQVVIHKSSLTGQWIGKIREKEGIY